MPDHHISVHQNKLEMQLRGEAARRRELDMETARKEKQLASRLRARERCADLKRAEKMKEDEDLSEKLSGDSELAKERAWRLAQEEREKIEKKKAAVIKYDIAA